MSLQTTQLFSLTDNHALQHKCLVIGVSESWFNNLQKELMENHLELRFSSYLVAGRPQIVFHIGGFGEAIFTQYLDVRLSDNSELGEHFCVNDNVILIMTPQTEIKERLVNTFFSSKNKLTLLQFDWAKNRMIVCSFTFTSEMANIFYFYQSYNEILSFNEKDGVKIE